MDLDYLLMIMIPLSICIILHEGGHFYAASYYGVSARRISIFFNALVTLFKYDPASGRISFISRQVAIPLTDPEGNVHNAGGEWALLSIPVSRAYVPDSYYDSENGMLYPYKGVLFGKEVIKLRQPEDLAKWRRTQYCIGWIPFGGYVTLKQSPGPGSLQNISPMQRFVINAAGVTCNLLTLVLVLTILRIIMGDGTLQLNSSNFDIMMVAFLSYSLFWLNILPIPGLDGGAMARNLAHAIMQRYHTTLAANIVNVGKRIYNLLSWVVLLFILSTWFRPAAGFEREVFRFFNDLFAYIVSLWGIKGPI